MFRIEHYMFYIVRDHIPLEQGLRLLLSASILLRRLSVRDHIPLEQGLRRLGVFHLGFSKISQRPYSIRTRIKTDKAEAQNPFMEASETIFH